MSQSYLSSTQYWARAYDKRLRRVPGLTPKQRYSRVSYFRKLLKRQKPTVMAGFARNFINAHT